jgi:ribonuclease HI
MDDLLRLAIDGGSRGNPGPAAWGAVVLDAAGSCVEGHGELLGRATNNVAEYRALLGALEIAERRGARRIEIRSDSELLVRQVVGRYRVRNPALQSLHAEAARRIGRFESFRIVHVRREDNRHADRVVNRLLDEAEAGADTAATGE